MILRAAPFQGPPKHGGTPSHKNTTPLIRIPPLIRKTEAGPWEWGGTHVLGEIPNVMAGQPSPP